MSDTPNQQSEKNSLEGTVPPMDTPEQRRWALEQAFDYRGDVTVHTEDGQTLEGYVFDRRDQGQDMKLRMMLSQGGQATFTEGAVVSLCFSGRDTAAGKSWETWVKKYVEKKRREMIEKGEIPPSNDQGSQA